MIYLNEVCEKLSEILNSDSNPAGFLYAVESVGFHADTVYDKDEGKNLIRVFVSSMGGNFNPIYGLGEANYTIPVTFYFPVRFKDSFFVLDSYLHSLFVGATLNYGANSGYAISNLSVATYGEIQDLDFREFKKWADSLYKKPIEVMEPYMSMTVNLYLSTLGSDENNLSCLWGNEVRATLFMRVNSESWRFLDDKYEQYKYLGLSGVRCPWLDITDTYLYGAFATIGGVVYVDINKSLTPFGHKNYVYAKDGNAWVQIGELLNDYSPSHMGLYSDILTFSQGSIQTMIQASEQKQLFDESETNGIPYSEATSQSFAGYVKKDLFWRIVALWQSLGALSTIDFRLKWEIPSLALETERKVYLASFNLPITKGNPLVASMTFAKRSE